ncbi:MAG: diacylglycerol/lipid kinase family protein, partial [Acutalibacteraceae bacterium]
SNGRFYGGGFQPTPMSSMRDGIIDLMLINAVSRLKVVQLMNCYREGKHLGIKGLCKHRRVKRVEVHTEKTMTMQMDGELFHGNSFVFETIAGGLNFIVPSTIDISKSPCLANPALEKPLVKA